MGKSIRTYQGSFKLQYYKAVIESELGDFTFHDLRYYATNNPKLARNDNFILMTISGHKTTSVFRRYNVVTDDELQDVNWKNYENFGVPQHRKTGKIG